MNFFQFKRNDEKGLDELKEFLSQIPAVSKHINGQFSKDTTWWVKFQIDINHKLAWHVVQELGHILNDLSLTAKLPCTFYPVSPPPYLNGGPEDYLSWVIESESSDFTPKKCKEWLQGRLPNPVSDEKQWTVD